MIQKRIAIVFWDLGIGGIQKRIRDISKELNSSHPTHRVDILLRRRVENDFGNSIEHLDNVQLHVYPFTNWYIRPPLGYVLWILILHFHHRYSTILTFLPPLSLAIIMIKKMLFWIPTRLIINDGVFISHYLHLRSQSWISPLITLLYPLADIVVVPSHACKNDLMESYTLRPEKIDVIPNWTLIKPKRSHNPTSDLLYIGRFEKEKGVFKLVKTIGDIAQSHPNITLTLVGSGGQKLQIESFTKTHKLHKQIQIKPFTTSIDSYLASSKVLVLNSINEGVPNVVLEAAMFQVPAVVNNFRGAEEIVIHGKTGYIAKDTIEFKHYIYRLLENKQKRKQMGKTAQKRILKHYHYSTQKHFINTLLNTINKS